jgi:hypothetical protein
MLAGSDRLDRPKPAVARLRESVANTWAKISAVWPELNLPSRRAKPNPNFARDELPRLVHESDRKAPAMKGFHLPGSGTMKRTRIRVGQLFTAWGKVGRIGKVERKRATRRLLLP